MATLHGAPERFAGGLHEVADGIHAWLQPNGTWGESNAALVAGDGASALVDSLWTPALTRRMLDAMAPVLAGAPLTRLVNTHADGDHCWGNAAVAERAGAELEIVATTAAASEMRHLAPRTLVALGRLGRGLGAAGRLPVPFPGRSGLRTTGSFFEGMLRPFDFGGIELVPPTRTFEGSLEVEAGGRPLELIEVGPAHTDGDLVVHVPDARAVLAADVLFIGVTPVMWAGPVERWLAALDRIEALDPAVIVPGHGPVCGLEEVALLRRYWEWVSEEARPRFGDGQQPEDAAREMLASSGFRDAPWSEWDNPERLVISLHTIDRHLAGGDGPVSPLARIRIFAEAGRLAAGLRAPAR